MSIKGGLSFIESQQRQDGGFWEYNLGNANEGDPSKYRTIYTPSMIALALSEVSASRDIRKKIVQFLHAEKSSSISWNYWSKGSAIFSKKPYPDDLDDTFLALSVLWRQDKRFFNPKISARIAQLLIANETQPGGPYRTWLVEGESKDWSDVDVVVNANIAGFLALQDIELPYLTALAEEAIKGGDAGLASPYYPSPIHTAYFISKWYKGDLVDALQRIILSRQKNGFWESSHQTALSITALIRLGYSAAELNNAVSYLYNEQAADGSWPEGAMCIGIGGCPSGAASLTTALCVEAITLHKKALRHPQDRQQFSVHQANDFIPEVVQKRVRGISNASELRMQLIQVLNRIIDRDGDGQIVNLPNIIATAANINVDVGVANKLSLASLWGWMAYTIYDDFLDDEGNPGYLPAAVFSQRQMIYTFAEVLPQNEVFHNEIDMIFDRIDQANTWEVKHCRAKVIKENLHIADLPDYGDYWQLADRSLGHSIAGLGIFYSAAIEPSSVRMQGLRNFFRHYLIARQLNDDAHDWEADLRLGHVNAVAVRILERWQHVHSRKKRIHLVKDKEALELIMWEMVIDEVCKDINWHVAQARAALKEADLDEKSIMPLLRPLKTAAGRALSERNDALEFLESLQYTE